VFQVEQRRLGDMLVVQEGLGVVDRAILGFADVMLLADIVVPRMNPVASSMNPASRT